MLSNIDEYYIKCNVIEGAFILFGKGCGLYNVLTNLYLNKSTEYNNIDLMFKDWITFKNYLCIKESLMVIKNVENTLNFLNYYCNLILNDIIKEFEDYGSEDLYEIYIHIKNLAGNPSYKGNIL